MTPTDEHPRGYSIFFSRVVSIIAMMIGSAVLFGWLLDIAALKSVFPGLVSMKANTAIGILLCGVVLALLSWKRTEKPLRYLAVVMALVVMALGALTLCEYLLGWDLRIDQWLFSDVQRATGTSHPGRMSPASTLCFVFTGAALLVATLPIALRLRQATVAALGATLTALGVLALAGYLLEAGLGYHIWNYTGTAVHTATSFILLGCGLLALIRSEGGMVWSLDAMTTVGFIAAIALMITMAGISYNFAKQQQQTVIWVSHSQEVLKEVQAVMTDVASIESSQRGYIITGEESLLARFVQAKAQIPMSLNNIRNLTADNTNQHQRLDLIESLIAPRVDLAEQISTVYKQQGFAAAQQMIATGKGIALTDSLGHLLKEMQDEEYALLEGRQKQSAAASVTTFLLLPLGAFLSLAMLSLGLFLFNTGVTEQAQAERAMEESEARMAGIVNSAMDAIISVSSEQKIILFNSAAEKIFRCSAAQAIGQPIQTFIPQRFHEQHRQHVQGFGQTGVTSRSVRSLGILSGLRFDGEEFPLEASISQVEVAGQKIFTVILRDITERKQAEEALREKEQQLYVADHRLAEIVHGMTEACFALDAGWRFTFINDRGETLLRHRRDEMLGQSIWEVFHKLVGTPMEAYYRRAMAERVPLSFEAFSPIAERWLDIRLFPSGDGLAAFLLDIDERKQVEVERQKFVSLAENSIEFIGMCDLQGVPFFVNEAGLRLVGLDNLAQALQTPVTEFFFPEDHAFIGEEFLPKVQRQGHGEVEIRFRHFKTGAALWMIYNVFVVRDVNAQPVGFATVSRNITERRLAENTVRQSEDRLAFALQVSGTGAWDLDLSDHTAYRSLVHDRIFGYQTLLPVWTYEMFLDHVLPDDRSEVDSLFSRAMANKEDWNFECRIRRSDGEVRWIWACGRHRLDESGAPRMMSGIVQDITERKRAAEELQHQSNITKTIASNAASCLFMMNKEGHPTFMNLAAEVVTGYLLDEIKDKPLHYAVHYKRPDGSPYPMSECPIDNASAELVAVHEQEEIFVRKDGSLFPVAYSVAPLERDGQTIGAVLEFRDITEHKQAEAMLVASEGRYRRLFESAKDGILILDAETGMIVDVNPFLIEMLGFSHKAFLGKKIWELGFFKDIVANQDNFAQLGEKEYIRYEDKPLETADGRRIEVEFVSNVYLVNRQKVIQCNIRDITERKRAEEEIRLLNAELEQRVFERTTQLTAVNKELEAFSYSVSHDLRAPLRHINGFSQALLEDYADKLDEEGKSHLQEVRNASNDMAQLIDDVLQLARVTRSEMRREVVNLSEIVLEVITGLKQRNPKREVNIQVEERLLAQGDKRLLRIMLTNLLENAWKFTSKREFSEIAFRQQQQNGETVYLVRDNGAGFNMAYAGKLFSAFQRLHSVAEFEGTGVGLATVQRIILRHGGRVWAEAAVDKGATFYFTVANFKEE